MSSKGYGNIWIDKKSHLTHRVYYKLIKGTIDDSLFLCHKCDTPACINPDHMFQGTNLDNMTDMAKKGRSNQSKKTHCRRGHEYNEENTRRYKNARVCKKCGVINVTNSKKRLLNSKHP